MHNFENEIKFLRDIDTDKLPHTGRNLLEHLIGVSNLLKEYGRDKVEQKAGLFHSIYGTEYYKDSKKLNIDRQQIKDLIGEEAEEIVNIFCNLNNRTKTILEGKLQEPYKTQLRWLEYTNLKEQNSDNVYLPSFEKILNIHKEYKPFLNVMSIFPTPLGIINYGEMSRGLNKQLIIDIEKERELNETQLRTFSGNDSSWQSELGMEKKYNSFKSLQQVIQQAVDNLLQLTHLKKEYLKYVKVYNLWSNVILKDGGWSQPHIHGDGNSLWSGVYYPKSIDSDKVNLDDFNENEVVKVTHIIHEDGVLVLKDPAKIIKQLSKGRKFENKLFYGGDNYIVPREGLLVLFPASLEHYVTPVVNFKEKRYSISFVADIITNGVI